MIATSDRRPGRFGALSSYDPRRRGASCARVTRSPDKQSCRAYGLFASSSGCQSRLSHWGVGPAGAISFLDKPDGAREGTSHGHHSPPSLEHSR
jgi:hypothetical protein